MNNSETPWSRKVERRALDYFLTCVKFNTQADPSSDSIPTSQGQIELGKEIVSILQGIGAMDIIHDEKGYVYATIPSNLPADKTAPTIVYLAHMDTSPECSGKDVDPQVWENYDGGDITLPGDTSKVIAVSEYPELKNYIGDTIITADGTTLLGADNKAGIAAMLDAAWFLLNDSNVPEHGEIRLVFTPDEEIQRDAKHLDLDQVNADFGFTMDGGTWGEVSYENFNAAGCTITVEGCPAHPGYAFGKMENALRALRAILNLLPKGKVPEEAKDREPFIYEMDTHGDATRATTKLALRSFDDDGLQIFYGAIDNAVKRVQGEFPKSTITHEFEEQYRNMLEMVEANPMVRECAEEGMQMIGITPVVKAIRGGTTGANLAFMGLICPNLFVGEHGIHGYYEWTTRSEMEAASDTIVAVSHAAVGKVVTSASEEAVAST